MLKVEIKEKVVIEDNEEEVKQYLVINDIPDENSFYIDFGPPSAHFYRREVIDVLISKSFEDIGQTFSMIGFAYEYDWWETGIDFDIICEEYYREASPSIKATIMLDDWEHWAKPWSMADLAKKFRNNVNLAENSNIEYW